MHCSDVHEFLHLNREIYVPLYMCSFRRAGPSWNIVGPWTSSKMSILIKILLSYTQIYFRENKIYDSDVYAVLVQNCETHSPFQNYH